MQTERSDPCMQRIRSYAGCVAVCAYGRTHRTLRYTLRCHTSLHSGSEGSIPNIPAVLSVYESVEYAGWYVIHP